MDLDLEYNNNCLGGWNKIMSWIYWIFYSIFWQNHLIICWRIALGIWASFTFQFIEKFRRFNSFKSSDVEQVLFFNLSNHIHWKVQTFIFNLLNHIYWRHSDIEQAFLHLHPWRPNQLLEPEKESGIKKVEFSGRFSEKGYFHLLQRTTRRFSLSLAYMLK